MTTRLYRSAALVLLTLALNALAIGCSGTEGDDCTSHADCQNGLFCSDPNPLPVCGIPPQQDCATDADCFGADQVCNAVLDPCSPDGIGSSCGQKCTGASGCGGTALRCNPTTEACEAIPCDEDFACNAHQVCTPDQLDLTGPVHARHHGCFDVACTSDSDCADDLMCVNSRCQTGGGFCREPQQVP